MKKTALIIANWQYEDPLLRALVSPSKDAESLARVLGDPAIGGFDVQVLTNVPSYRICEETEALFGDRERDDLLLFYFSGHGVTDDEGQLYYAASNTLHKRLRSTAVAASWVNDVMNECRSRRQVMLLDCCHSGAFARTKAGGAVNTGKYFTGSASEEGRGKFILTACDAFQYSFEGESVEGLGTNSVFTEAVIQGLRTGGADTDNDGFITLDELYDFVFHHVRERNPQQTPRKWASDVEGAVVIAANPNPLEAPLPEDLQAAIDSFVAEIREKAISRLDKLLRGKHRGLALSANKTLLALATDDSRRVSAAAELCLSAFQRDRAAGVIRTDRFEALPIPAAVLPVKPDSARPEGGKVENPHVPYEDSAAAKASPSLHSMAEPAKPFDDGRRALDKQPAAQVSAEISHSSTHVSAHPQVPADVLSDSAPDARTEPAPAIGLPSPKWSSDDERSAQLRSFGKSLAAKVAEDDALKRYVAGPASTRTPGSARRPFSRSILFGAGALVTILAFSAIVWWAFVPKHASPETSALTARVAKPDQPQPEQTKPDKPVTEQKSVQPAADTVRPTPSPVEAGPSPLRESNSPASEISSAKNTSPRQRESPPSKASASSAVDTSPAYPSTAPAPSASPSQGSPSPAPSPLVSKSNDEPPAGAVAETAPTKQSSKVVESSDFSPAMHAVPPSLHITLTPDQAKALLLSRSPAKYPEVARAAGVTGTVVVDTHVSRKGTVQRLEILDGPPLLRQAALDALKSWRFKPYLVNGDAVEWRTTINIGFNLNKE
jgi:TonB family protein